MRVPWIGALLAAAGFQVAAGAVVTPGPRSDGSMLLHNLWPIRPVGRQVPLGDFPVALALHPGGNYAAVLHSGYGPHEIWVVDLRTDSVAGVARVRETYGGLAFSRDGTTLYCSGGGDGVLHAYRFADGRLAPLADVPVPVKGRHAVVGEFALSPRGDSAFVGVLFASHVVRIDLRSGKMRWNTALDTAAEEHAILQGGTTREDAPNDVIFPTHLVEESDPFGIAFDARRHRVFAALWGRSAVAVLDSDTGAEVARWPAGLHPNQLLLSPDDSRLFVANGGRNSVSVFDARTGAPQETLCSAFSPQDPPGSTPDSLALSSDGRTLFAANGYTNNIAVFDVSRVSEGAALGFIPTGWYPTSVRLTRDGRRLLVTNARGLKPEANLRPPRPGSPDLPPPRTIRIHAGPHGPDATFPYIGTIYEGTLGIVDWPGPGGARDAALRRWTLAAESCRPAPLPPVDPSNPVPARAGGPTPIKYVIYIIRENRTYDEVLGDMKEGNGDPSIVLFGENTTPNMHRLARQFVLLDNFYANAEISASGHEWSTGAYSSEFVERNWPLNYGHKKGKVPYPAEGGYLAAVPASGYLWDRAAEAGVTYRDYGEFVHGNATPRSPSEANLPALKRHVDPLYRGWSLTYSDALRADRFISELRRFDAAGEMPRFQIVRLPNDHTEAARAGALDPRAMVAQNDLALGRLVDAVSHSRFWPRTAIFVVEDDAQNGPDHVDAHRTVAGIFSPYVRHGTVDSTAYTTCSMLATIERLLGFAPMSQFDAAADPMTASFQAKPDPTPYTAVPAGVPLDERNPAHTAAARISATFDFSREDAIDDQAFNHVIWAAMRGEQAVMPAPVHAAFVRPFPKGDDDDEND